MDWTLPDRPRRVVTYGKNAQSRAARLQTSQIPKDANGNGVTSRRPRTGIQSRSLLDSPVQDIASGPTLPSQNSLPSVRSPKRRKLTPTDDDDDDDGDDDDNNNNGNELKVKSPRPQIRRGSGIKNTYGSRNSLYRSMSDVPKIDLASKSSESGLSLSPDQTTSKPSSSSRSRTLVRSQTDVGVTPLRKRLVDALGSLSDQDDDDSESTDSERDSLQEKATDVLRSRETTPTAGDSQTSYNNDSQSASQWSQRTQSLVEASPQSGSPKVTYARQRSFLRNIDLPVDSAADPIADFSTSLLSPPLQQSLKDNADASQNENLGTISSIHELRRAGVNARFQGLVDSVFEDIEDRSSSASVRRGGYIQLCEKLQDEKFAQRFIEIGGFKRLMECKLPRPDLVSSLLSAYACALLLRLNHIPSTIWAGLWTKLIDLSSTLLPLDEGVSKFVSQRRLALSRVNQAAIRDIALGFGRVTGLGDQESTALSPRRLILRCLYSTIRRLREKDVAESIPTGVISQLVEILLEYTDEVASRDKPLEDYVDVEGIVTILETYTTASDITTQAQQDVLLPLTKSSHLLSSLSDKTAPHDIQLLTLHLRLLLNITNASPGLCGSFATSEVIRGLISIVLSNYDTAAENQFIDEKKDSLDVVILALGALINLTEVSETARQDIINQKIDSQSLLERLLSIFTRGLDSVSEADSVVQTHSNVAFGYLSILLCAICLDRDAYRVLQASMKGTGLVRLLATVEEFLHYHRKVDEELQQAQSVKEFTIRLQRILNQIHAMGT